MTNSHLQEQYLELARKFHLEGDFMNAIVHYTKALEQCGEVPQEHIYRFRAAAWAGRGEYEIAVMDINDALRKSPCNAKLYGERGKMHRQLALYGKAVRDFTLAIDLDPKGFVFYYDRSVAHAKDSNWSAALQDIEAAIKFSGNDVIYDNPEFYIQRAEILLHHGELEKALQDCRLALSSNSPSARAYCICADVFLAMGDMIQEHQMRQKAVEADSSLKDIDLSSAKSHLTMQKYDEAVFYCDRYIQAMPSSYEAYQVRAEAHYQMSNLDQAKRDCDRAVEYNPYCKEAYRTRAKIFRKKGDYLSAEQDRKHIERLEKMNHDENEKGISQ